ncbi:hypothetical protein GCM10022631_34060 [Deinococcus rubellus]
MQNTKRAGGSIVVMIVFIVVMGSIPIDPEDLNIVVTYSISETADMAYAVNMNGSLARTYILRNLLATSKIANLRVVF